MRAEIQAFEAPIEEAQEHLQREEEALQALQGELEATIRRAGKTLAPEVADRVRRTTAALTEAVAQALALNGELAELYREIDEVNARTTRRQSRVLRAPHSSSVCRVLAEHEIGLRAWL